LILYVILKNFFWGEWLVCRSVFLKNIYKIEIYFLPFYIKYLKLFIGRFFVYYYYFFYNVQYQIYEYMNQGFIDLLILPNIVEYFVWGKAFDKKYSPHASKSLYIAGFFCIVRGYYCWTYMADWGFDPKNPERLVPFWDFESSPYILKAYNSANGPFYFVDLDKFLEIRALQSLERFIFGRVLTYGFALDDSYVRVFVPQRWSHNFKLE